MSIWSCWLSITGSSWVFVLFLIGSFFIGAPKECIQEQESTWATMTISGNRRFKTLESFAKQNDNRKSILKQLNLYRFTYWVRKVHCNWKATRPPNITVIIICYYLAEQPIYWFFSIHIKYLQYISYILLYYRNYCTTLWGRHHEEQKTMTTSRPIHKDAQH